MDGGYSGYSAPTDFNSDGGFIQGSSSQGNSSGAAFDAKKHLVPCTIKQLVDSAPALQDGTNICGNLNLTNVSIVGVVRTITDKDSFSVLTIEDGSGQIEFRIYHNTQPAEADGDSDMGMGDFDNNTNSSDDNKKEQYTVGEYVKVYATPRLIGDTLGLQYVVVQRINSYNEVVAHLLNAAKVYMISEGKINENGEKTNGGLKPDGSNNTGNSLFLQDDDQTPGQKIITLLHESKGSFPNGIPLRFISEKLGMSLDEVRDTTQNFIDEGLCYTTLEDHVELT
ncbi:hypothetical protein ACO0RG_000276 [Hanseniaspora osmophila]|uniref:Replication factor A protein 2 n=1 Tax=Hanseniaspora osmophila TaxID=56408 RepID=A0A1E5R521_9ASCO|nr:Replication factor A protein 2 [Hanseniaspora osmophila]